MAAGLGFKTFTTGEVLTAADTNGYLMQGVLVFASSAARAAAITSPQEGQYSYLKDTNSTEYYDGAAWIAAPIGDITAVTAGTGISGGGTSGAVTITNSMATEITAKGDLIAGTGSATFDNLPVGTNGQTLVADSTASTGLKWATPTSGGMTLLSTTTLSSTSTTISSINQTYTNLFFQLRGVASGGQLLGIRLNGITTGSYYFQATESGNARAFTASFESGNSSFQFSEIMTADASNAGTINIFDYASTNASFKLVQGSIYSDGDDDMLTFSGVLRQASTAIDSITFLSTGTISGDVLMYGVK